MKTKRRLLCTESIFSDVGGCMEYSSLTELKPEMLTGKYKYVNDDLLVEVVIKKLLFKRKQWIHENNIILETIESFSCYKEKP